MPKTSKSNSKTQAARRKSSNQGTFECWRFRPPAFSRLTGGYGEAKEKPQYGFSLSSEATAEDRYGRMSGFPFVVSQRLVEANHHAKHQSMNAACGLPPLP